MTYTNQNIALLKESFEAIHPSFATSATDEAFAELSSMVGQELSAFDVLTRIDTQIGKHTGELQQIYLQVRLKFADLELERENRRLQDIFTVSSADGWREWAIYFCKTITSFRHPLSLRFCQLDFPFSTTEIDVVHEFKRAAKLISESSWADAYNSIEHMAGLEFISETTRSELFVILGQIQQYWFFKIYKADLFFRKAEALSPNHWQVLTSLGRYWLEKGDKQKSTSYYTREINLYPSISDGYAGLARVMEKESRDAETEAYLLKAIEHGPGEASAYLGLMKFYISKDRNEDQLEQLLHKALILSHDVEYGVYIDIGTAYNSAGRFDESLKYFDKALSINERMSEAFSSKGYLFTDTSEFENARVNFQQVIELAPNSIDGYWGMALSYELELKFATALEWYHKCPTHIPDYRDKIRAKIGDVYRQLEDFQTAALEIRKAFALDHQSSSGRSSMEILAEKYYTEKEDRDSATRLYAEIFNSIGPSYEPDYHNRLANIRYYNYEYQEAIDEYRKAIECENRPVFYRNLSLAYQGLKKWDVAKQHLLKANELDQNEGLFNREMAKLCNGMGEEFYQQQNYSEAVEQYQEAIKHNPSNDNYFSNLAKAFENTQKEKSESLSKAITALEQASSINPIETYKLRINDLKLKQKMIGQLGESFVDQVPLVAPIALELAPDLIPLVEAIDNNGDTILSDQITELTNEMRSEIERRYGVTVPGIRFRGNEYDLDAGRYIILINDAQVASGYVNVHKKFVFELGNDAIELTQGSEEGKNPVTGEVGFWLTKAEADTFSTTAEISDSLEYIMKHLQKVLAVNLKEFTGHQEVANLLEAHVDLTDQPETLTQFTMVCKSLVSEGVPIKPIGFLFDTFNRLLAELRKLSEIVEVIRSAPSVRQKLPGNTDNFDLFCFGEKFETLIRRSLYSNNSTMVLALPAMACQDVLRSVRTYIYSAAPCALVVKDAALRPYLRKLTELEFPELPVLSVMEAGSERPITEASFHPENDDDLVDQYQSDATQNKSPEIIRLEKEPNEKISITVSFNPQLINQKSIADTNSIREMFNLMKDGLFYELGLILPEVVMEHRESLAVNEFQIKLNDFAFDIETGLQPDEFLVNDTLYHLDLLNVEGTPKTNPANGIECVVVKARGNNFRICEAERLTTWGPLGFIVLALSSKIRSRAHVFQNPLITEFMLNKLAASFPSLVQSVRRRHDVVTINAILSGLLKEEITIRDLRSVLEGLLMINGTNDADVGKYIPFYLDTQAPCFLARGRSREPSIADLVDFVRASLRRYISYKFSKGAALPVHLVDIEVEDRLTNNDAEPLTPSETENILNAIRDAIGEGRLSVVILTRHDIRRILHELIRKDFPYVHVVSYNELSPDMEIHPSSRRISFESTVN